VKNVGGDIDQEAYLRSAKALASKMHLGYFREPKKDNEYHRPQLSKKEKWYDLSLDNKIDIIHEVLILKRPQQDVAKKYYRTAGYVSRFVKRFRQNRKLLREMIDQRDQAVAKAEVVQEVIQELLDENTFIENIQQVIEECQIRQQLEVKPAFIRKQLAEMRISYRKVKHVNFQANSERCLVLRQRWAVSFLELNWRHKNVINIDESWLGMTDFRRMHWRPTDRNWSVKAKALQPRISMITAVDKLGNVWVCLSMSNSNKGMMGVFMEHLCKKLDQ
jgi:transposase